MKNYKLNKKQLQELRNAHRRPKRNNETIIAADKIKAVYLLGSGWAVKRVMEVLMIDETTLRRYFTSYQESGIDGLVETNYKGSGGFLSDAEEADLDGHLESHPCMNTLEVIGL